MIEMVVGALIALVSAVIGAGIVSYKTDEEKSNGNV